MYRSTVGVTGKRVGGTKERERRNELAMTSNEGDNGNGRDWLKCDHAGLRSPIS